MVRLEAAALALAEVADDLVGDMETIALNLPPMSKRTHELEQSMRVKCLARAFRVALAEYRRAT